MTKWLNWTEHQKVLSNMDSGHRLSHLLDCSPTPELLFDLGQLDHSIPNFFIHKVIKNHGALGRLQEKMYVKQLEECLACSWHCISDFNYCYCFTCLRKILLYSFNVEKLQNIKIKSKRFNKIQKNISVFHDLPLDSQLLCVHWPLLHLNSESHFWSPTECLLTWAH